MCHRITLLFACGLAVCGCTPSLQTSGRVPELRERWLPSYVFGIYGEPAVDVREVCESGVATGVSVGANVGTVVVSLVTLGMYTPRKVWVACAPRGN